MKRTSMSLAILASLSCQPAQAEPDHATAAALSALHGTFVSTAAEPWYGGFGTREFVFADGHWSLTFIHALDPEMTLRTFAFRTGGAYAVTAPSATVEGAFEATFHEEWKHLTRLTADETIAAAIGLAACNLPLNLEVDISVTGCAAWLPVAICGLDHDLLALNAEGLFFGVRPADNDMCTSERRPTALLPPVVLQPAMGAAG